MENKEFSSEINTEVPFIQEQKDYSLLSSIYNYVDLAIWVMDVTEEGDFIFVGLNPAHERLTGLKTAEVQGKKPHDFLPLEMAEAVSTNYRNCLKAGKVVEYEEKLFFNGKDTWWSTRLIPVMEEHTKRIYRIIGASLNISEKKSSENKFAELLELNQKILSFSPSGILMYDQEGDCIYTNQAAMSIFGFQSRQELLTKKFDSILPWPDQAISEKILQIRGKNNALEFMIEIKDFQQEFKMLQVFMLPFNMHEHELVLVIINDITTLKKAEREALEQKAFIETLISTLPLPLYYKDIKGKCLGCNAEFEKLIGRNANEIIGKTVTELLPENLVDTYEKMDQLLLANPKTTQHFESVIENIYRESKNVLFHKAVYYNQSKDPAGIIGIVYDITERKRIEKDLLKLSIMDELTGTYNKRGMNEFYLKEWQRSKRNNTPISIVMIDIDFFKDYNDSFGHQAGDSCLYNVAQALNKHCRRPGDIIARYGGEEFIAILPETTLQGALVVAENLRAAVEFLAIKRKGEGVVTISLGVSSCSVKKECEPSYLLQKADEALYLAKKNGRNRVEIQE